MRSWGRIWCANSSSAPPSWAWCPQHISAPSPSSSFPLAATIPANWAAEAFGWRAEFAAMALIIAGVAALIFFLVPERQEERPRASIGQQLHGLARAATSRQFWQVAPLVMFGAGGNIAVQTLWTGPWLRDV